MSQTQPIDPRYVNRPPTKPKKKRHWFLRTVGLIVLLFVLMLIAVPLYAWSRIDKIDAMPTGERPADTPGTTYLMVGSDSRENLSRAERARLHTGGDAGSRTDSIMLMHVPESGPTVLISIPRDSAVDIPGVKGKQKINAAFNKGPALLIETIESETGLRIDHYVQVGFGGFASIIDSVGGVTMCLPKAMKDDKAHIDLPAGCQELDGVNALGYVRSRKADGKNDFGRTERQREMVGAVAKKASSPSTFLNPVRYYNVATKGVDALTVDKEMGLFDFGRFALGMRAVSGGDGVLLSVPVSDENYQLKNNRGVAVRWDKAKAEALFNALKEDNTSGLKSS